VTWAGLEADGVVGQKTGDAPLSLEFAVGLQNIVGTGF
jgi:hypothetical protein